LQIGRSNAVHKFLHHP